MILSKALRRFSCVIAIAYLIGCDSTSHLNETSGKSMLIAKIAADQRDNFVLPFGIVLQTLNEHTQNDYSQGSYPEYLPAAFNGQHSPTAIVAEAFRLDMSPITNLFYRPRREWRLPCRIELAVWGVLSHESHVCIDHPMKPTANSISGHYHEESTGGGAQWANGPLAGSVDANGIVHLAYENVGANGILYGAKKLDYTFTFTNGEKRLTGQQAFQVGPDMTLVGHGPSGEITVPVYSYALSNKFKTLPPPHQYEFQAGKLEIDQITNLLLASDTSARIVRMACEI